MKSIVLAAAIAASAASASAESPQAASDLPDRFHIDTGAFLIDADTRLRYNGEDVVFERDLRLDDRANSLWLDGTWRLGRRHQLKLNYTRLGREGEGVTLQRDITWGSQLYAAGLTVAGTTETDILSGYYHLKGPSHTRRRSR